MRLPFRRPRARDLPAPRDFPYVELRGGGTSALLIPTLGGRIAELCLAGRQWLWQSDLLPMAPGVNGASYVETADAGGFDECFPTVGACRVPGWVRGAGGIELPDHGELWSQVPAIEVRTGADGQRATCRWGGLRLPYSFERTLRIDARGVVHLSYTATNEGTERLPFVWSAHPLFPLTEHTRIGLPEGTRMRVFARHVIELGELRSDHRWPFVRSGAHACDFRAPFEVARRYACKLFLDMTDGWATLREGGDELRLRWPPGDVTHMGVWINKRGWTPFRDEEPYLNLAFEPAIGAPDTLSDALGDWKSAAWLEPGEQRRWQFTIEGGRADL